VNNSAQYIYFSSLHVSGHHVPIIRRNYCIYETLVFVTLYGWCWSAGWSETPTSIPDSSDKSNRYTLSNADVNSTALRFQKSVNFSLASKYSDKNA